MTKNVKNKPAPKKTRLPVPANIPAVPTPLPKGVKRAEGAHLAPLAAGTLIGTPAVLDRLWHTVEDRRHRADAATSHSARLLKRGTPKVAQKLGEEAVELVIEAVLRNRDATVSEAADVLYHLMVLLVDADIPPGEVWGELERREGISGIVEKASRPRPRALLALARTAKLP